MQANIGLHDGWARLAKDCRPKSTTLPDRDLKPGPGRASYGRANVAASVVLAIGEPGTAIPIRPADGASGEILDRARYPILRADGPCPASPAAASIRIDRP